ncbi:hypothetical protein ACIBH1_45495 [Nonomuraea sp. NPDC050663]|uniref:hypothetical protein n=1 Tax=Nonomuraea sp. NPDC050663 TaxID=3364370 RepID=UPI00378AE4E3
MNITISVDEISLATVVADTIAYDEEGDAIISGEKTVADLVAAQIVERLTRDDHWPRMREQVMEIRKEQIREALRPTIDTALNRPIFKTNGYGERIGQETTLSELISDEARAWLTAPANQYRREDGTLLEQAIRAEVKHVVQKLVADAVQKAVAAMEDKIAAQAEQLIADTAKKTRGGK